MDGGLAFLSGWLPTEAERLRFVEVVACGNSNTGAMRIPGVIGNASALSDMSITSQR